MDLMLVFSQVQVLLFHLWELKKKKEGRRNKNRKKGRKEEGIKKERMKERKKELKKEIKKRKSLLLALNRPSQFCWSSCLQQAVEGLV